MINSFIFFVSCRNGSGSSAGTSGSRDQSPTYQNWSQNHQNSQNFHPKDEAKKTNSASDCTSSTECSEDSDRNSDHANENKKIFVTNDNGVNKNTPTPAPRTTLEKQAKSSLQSSLRSVSVERVKQVRHESLV